MRMKIKTACLTAGMSESKLAEQMGWTRQNFSQRMKFGKFSQDEYEKMAEILGCEYHSSFVFPDGNVIE